MKRQKLISVAVIIIGWALPLVSWAEYREYSCDEQEAIPATEENCKACGSSRRYSNGMCIFAKCSADKIQGEIEGTGGTFEPGCFDCSEPATILTTSNACSQCIDANGTPTRTQRQSEMWSGKVDCSLKECPADTFRSKNGACIPCDSSTGAKATKAQCDTCPGREYDTASSLCYLSTVACLDRDGYLTSEGDCAACTSTDEYQILAGKESLCWSCSNARYLDGSQCRVPCPKGTVPGSTATSFLQCRSCLVSEPMQTPYCGACPERVQTNIDNVEFCVLKTCGSDEFLTKNGNCVPCDILAPQDTDATLCTCTNREMVNGQCVLKTCPDGKFRDQNGACFDCTVASNIPQTDETECAKCTNRELYAGYCIPRCATGTYRYSADECRSCDTVQEGTVTSNIQVCTDCGFTPTQITSDSSYVCRKTCPAGQFNGGNGQCYACDTTEIVPTGPEACAVCGDVREHQSGVCLLKTCLDGMFRGRKAGTAYDACYACDDISQITSGECTQKCGNTRILGKNNICYSCQELKPFDAADQTACEQCPNRTYSMMGKCTLSQCPDNTFSVYENYEISCYACDETRHDLKSSDCLEKCGDQRVLVGEYCAKACQPGEFRDSSGNCISCDNEDSRGSTAEECAKCGDKKFYYNGWCTSKFCKPDEFRSTNDYAPCVSCDHTSPNYRATAEECAKCGDQRKMVEYGFCVLKSCPDGQFQSNYGDCTPCTSTTIWKATKEECDKCPQRSLMTFDDTVCALTSCPADTYRSINGECYPCATGQFVDATAGTCRECTDTTSYPGVSQEACESCPNRTYVSGYGKSFCVFTGN